MDDVTAPDVLFRYGELKIDRLKDAVGWGIPFPVFFCLRNVESNYLGVWKLRGHLYRPYAASTANVQDPLRLSGNRGKKGTDDVGAWVEPAHQEFHGLMVLVTGKQLRMERREDPPLRTHRRSRRSWPAREPINPCIPQTEEGHLPVEISTRLVVFLTRCSGGRRLPRLMGGLVFAATVVMGGERVREIGK